MYKFFTSALLLFSFFLLSLLIFSDNTFAQAGRLDSSFGVNGIVQTNIPGAEFNSSNTVFAEPDGKIVVCGDNTYAPNDPPYEYQGLLLRYNKNGNLDSTFGNDGIILSTVYRFLKASLQPDGKIVIVVDSLDPNPNIPFSQDLIRYNTDGSLDTNFGKNGKVILNPGSSFVSILIEKSGKILLLSSSADVLNISRFLVSGIIDSSFNHTGFLNFSAETADPAFIVLQSGERIIVAYTNYFSDSTVVRRFDSTGMWDSTFRNVTGLPHPKAMVAQSDDKIILGYVICRDYKCDYTEFTCLRMNSDGSLDTTFNHTGIDTIPADEREVRLYSLTLDKNDKIILSGTYGVNDYYLNFFVTVRLLADGRSDWSFGVKGKSYLQIGTTHDYPYSVDVQSDNKILITGTSEEHIYDGRTHIATVRYNENGTLDQSFGTNGIDTPHIANPTLTIGTSLLGVEEGKTLVGGNVYSSVSANHVIVRYNEDGTIDSSFHHGRPLQSDLLFSAITLVNEKILEVGAEGSRIRIIRYNSDGLIDNSFGKNGHTSAFINDSTRWFGSGGQGFAPVTLIVQQDGKMIIAAFSVSSDYTRFYAEITRLNADGTVDSSFGNNGTTVEELHDLLDKFSLVLQPDGKILLGGGQSNPNSIYVPFYLFRFNVNGTLDSSFGNDGLAMKLIDSTNTGKIEGFILLQPDGKVLQIGNCSGEDPALGGIVAARFTTNGIVDSTFGVNGIVKTYIAAGNDYANAGVLQPDGKILIAGTAFNGIYGNYSILIRYLPDGLIDSLFGTNGIVTLTIPPDKSYDPGSEANTIIMQSDKILMAGNWKTDLYIARFINDITLGIINFSSPNNNAIVYPNPIHQTATLKYTLSEGENITINLFDINGKLVQTFMANQNQTKGNYSAQLNFSPSLAVGNYFLTVGNGKQKETVKIIKQ